MMTIIAILDIHPDWHALRTMLAFNGIEVADKLRPVLLCNLPNHSDVNLTDEDPPFWKRVWEVVQGPSQTLHTFDAGATWGSKCIHHVLAQMQMAEAFDQGQIPACSVREIMYAILIYRSMALMLIFMVSATRWAFSHCNSSENEESKEGSGGSNLTDSSV
jgi:hypothetical protein